MKTGIIIKLALIAALGLGAVTGIYSQDDRYMQAMQEEVKRGVGGLILDKMLPPGFISYHIVDANTLQISSVLGGIVRSDERRIIKFENRTLVIKEGTSNENFVDLDNLGTWSRHENNIPLTGGADDVRRALWLATDDNYKNALSTYEAKISAMRQQSLSPEEMDLPDFIPAEKQEHKIPHKPMNIDRDSLEGMARTVSAVFRGFGTIISSRVNVYAWDGKVYYYNSEGTLSEYPFQIAAVLIMAMAQTPAGELIFEHFLHFAKDLSEMPGEPDLVAEARKLAGYIDGLVAAPAVAEPYFGPVLIEGQAVAEIVARVLFGDVDGLVAVRKPIIGDEQIVRYAPDWIKENNLEAMMGRRIMSRDISIDALPGLAYYRGENLFGSFEVDAEGLPVADKVSLVEDGVLKNLLSSRVPTLTMRESNAHARLALNMASVRTVTAPGVIKMSVNEDALHDTGELVNNLLHLAREEGLEYAYIVRKVFSPPARVAMGDEFVLTGQSRQGSDRSKALRAYRIYVEDGREEPVSMAEIKGLNIRLFRRVIGASNDMQVYNTMFTPAATNLFGRIFDLTGTPVSYIVPRALLFSELDILRETQQFVRKPPVVENPVMP